MIVDVNKRASELDAKLDRRAYSAAAAAEAAVQFAGQPTAFHFPFQPLKHFSTSFANDLECW